MPAITPAPPKLARIRLDDGLTIAYREAGSGPAVLLLHGFPTSSYLWRETMAPMAERNRVIAIDLPGFGGSDKPADAAYDCDYYESVLERFVQALGISHVGVAGHDIGGAVAAHWAITRPERLTRLALLNTVLYPEVAPEVIAFANACRRPELRVQLTSDEGLAQILRDGVSDPARITRATLGAYLASFTTDEDRRTLARAAIGVGRVDFEAIALGLPHLQLPVCGVYGDDDHLLGDNADTFARLRRDIPSAEITSVANAGHFVQEDSPRPVGGLLARFFAGGEGSGTLR